MRALAGRRTLLNSVDLRSVIGVVCIVAQLVPVNADERIINSAKRLLSRDWSIIFSGKIVIGWDALLP